MIGASSKTINIYIWIDASFHRYWPWVGLISIIVLFAAVIVIKWGDKVIFFLFLFSFYQIVVSILNRFVKLASQWSTTHWLNNILLRHKWVYALHIQFHFWPFSFYNIWPFSHFDYQGGDFELMEDGNGTMMDYQVLIVDDYLLLKLIAFSLTEENICWSWFFCHEIVCTMDLFFLLSASYEGSYWICWIVMLWCIHTNCNNFLIVVISWLNSIGLCSTIF